MAEGKVYRAIGLMSGTALDGEIDVALLETDGHSIVKPLGFYTHEYDLAVRDKVRACFGKREHDAQTDEAEALVTDLHIAAVKASGFTADVIGFHGQTITHAPEDQFTWQLGDGARLAKETGMSVVADMRQADVKAGGQGAPLLPLYHQARLAEQKEPIVVLNLGGVANITYIDGEDILAFDCGPGNALMDDYCREFLSQDFDKDGVIAQRGQASQEMAAMFLEDDFFEDAPPKSLDRNEWETDIVGGLAPDDAVATLLEMSARGVWKGFTHLPNPPAHVYVCGGGRRNGFMMKRLAEVLEISVDRVEALGWNGDATEAEGFAYLAVRSLLKLPLTLPNTTGVSAPQTGGELFQV